MQSRQHMLLIQTNTHTPDLLTPATSIDFQSCNRLRQIQNKSGNGFHQPNIQKQKRFLTKEQVFNHETIQLHSDDFSNSPSFLKMSVQNTPLLFKFDSKGNPISESRQSIGQQSNFVQRFSKILQNNIDYENIPTTIKRENEDPPQSISVTPNWQDRRINKENKENTQRFPNKQKGRSINMNIYEMDNLIKIVDNMYEKAVDKKIQCNVNIELTNKYLKNKTVFGPLQNSDYEAETKDQRVRQGLTQRYSQIQNIIKAIPEISQIKTRRESNHSQTETNKVFISIDQLKNIQNNYQQLYKKKSNCDYDYSNLIKDENEDKKLTFTKRISIEVLPEDQNQYKCKQVPDGPQICEDQVPQLKTRSKKEDNIEKKAIKISHGHTKSQFEELKVFRYESNENSCRLFKSRQENSEGKTLTAEKLSQKRSKKSQRSESKKKNQVLVHYTVSKFNQIINSKPSEDSSVKSSQSSFKFKCDSKEERNNSKKEIEIKNQPEQRFEQEKKIYQNRQILFKKNYGRGQALVEYPQQQIKIEIAQPQPSQNTNEQMTCHIHPITFGSRKPNRNPLGYKGVYEQILSGYSTAKLLEISKKQYCNSIVNANKPTGENLEQKPGKIKSVSKNQTSRCQQEGNNMINMVASLRQSSMPKQNHIDGMDKNLIKLQLKHKSLEKNDRVGQKKEEGPKVYYLKNLTEGKDLFGSFYFNKVK